jgi:hypothetical protein
MLINIINIISLSILLNVIVCIGINFYFSTKNINTTNTKSFNNIFISYAKILNIINVILFIFYIISRFNIYNTLDDILHVWTFIISTQSVYCFLILMINDKFVNDIDNSIHNISSTISKLFNYGFYILITITIGIFLSCSAVYILKLNPNIKVVNYNMCMLSISMMFFYSILSMRFLTSQIKGYINYPHLLPIHNYIKNSNSKLYSLIESKVLLSYLKIINTILYIAAIIFGILLFLINYYI